MTTPAIDSDAVARILARMHAVDGWMEDDEAAVLVEGAASCVALDEAAAIVEVGSYYGRSTVVLACAVRELASEKTRVYAIDPHEGVVGAADVLLDVGDPTLEIFTRNLQTAGVQDIVVTLHQRSQDVAWPADRPIGLLFIDGLHDYENVARDFRHFEPYLRSGSLVAFHDHAPYYPGVVGVVDELVASGRYVRVGLTRTLMVLRRS